jgi:DNA-directed RNA polymerase specialized sigma24 family protein
MAADWSVSAWIKGVKGGDDLAAQCLWDRYFEKLVGLAHRKLQDQPRGPADSEDVALSAFASFCRAARSGRFPELTDRQGLWRLLLKITADKAVDQLRRQGAARRGGGQVRGESAFMGANSSGFPGGIDQVAGDEPTPEFAAMVADNLRALLTSLGDGEFQAIVLAKLEGCNEVEIAQRLGCAIRTVQRRLRLIRKTWQAVTDSSSRP